ncbi:MAG: hypothetical protein JHC98_00590 [Thermoleophilaceae bacterium]|nr:hypothetical protein [Thermoleophilaceae bacterium]
MQSVLGRAVLSCLLTLSAVALLSVSAFAGVTRDVIYCGDNDNGCTYGDNKGFDNQLSVMAERSLTQTGRYAWVGDAFAGTGHIWGRTPAAGSAVPDQTISSLYTDPTGDYSSDIGGLAFDPTRQVIFFSDSANYRVLAFHLTGNDAPAEAVDYTKPAQAPGPVTSGSPGAGSGAGQFNTIGGAGDMVYSTFNDRLYVVDYFNARVQIFSYVYGDGVSIDPSLDWEGDFGFNWNTDDTLPTDIAVNPADGHVFVTDLEDDTVQEFDPDGGWIRSIGSGVGQQSRSVAVDSPSHLLYAATSNYIDVYSLDTGNKLGRFEESSFKNQPGLSIIDIDVDPISRKLYVVLNTTVSTADADNPPVAAYTLAAPPTCTVSPELQVAPGSSTQIPLSCTDADGAPVKEFHRDTPPALGTITPNAERTTLTFNAGTTPGTDNLRYRVMTANGRSVVYNQPVRIVGSAEVPVVRKTANLSLTSGNVFIKLPGSDKFVPLTEDTLIPIGTVIDARDGKAHLTFANADGTLYDGVFWDGIFQVIQGKGDKPLATLKLRDDLVAQATTSIASAVATPSGFKAWTSRKRGKKKNGLWGDAKGKYRTSGKGGSATVRGTRWYVANYTYGSLFKVQRGAVTIDPIRGKNFTLKSGKQFFIFYKRGK